MTVETLLYGILLAPLVGITLNVVGYSRLGNPLAGWLATVMITVSAACSWALYFVYREPTHWVLYQWIDTDLFELAVGFYVDWLTVLMLLVVSTVSACVHLYSIEYMEEDEGFTRFFVYLNLFVFSMFVLVTAINLPMMFIGWEGVGLCSYLLIGFWYRRDSARYAGQKAFVVNRLGDFSFLLGMMLWLKFFGDFSFVGVGETFANASLHQLWSVGLLLFGGAIGKSAQFPLYVWLPDAMEGPTPVSSLIHAATMVTAGVYLIARLDGLYSAVASVGDVIAAVGAFTALFAATIATVHEDMKRILAYSTVSQLGYMFVGVGVGAYGAGIFHLMTHAFFKGLLFLMAGSVMHALHGELNIFRMDRLWDHLPVTGTMAIIGGLGLAGFPLVSGFWSKDEILLGALGHGSVFEWGLFLTLAVAALLTSFYTFRMIFVAFFTTNDQEKTYEDESVHASGWKMTVPMGILAVPTLAGYYLGGLAHKLTEGHAGAHGYHTIVMSVSVTVSLLGILVAYLLYVQKLVSPYDLLPGGSTIHRALREQYYVEELYRNAVVKPLRALSRGFWTILDDLIVDGIVNLAGATVDITGLILRFVQTGSIRHYLVYLTTAFSVLICLFTFIWFIV